MAGLLLTALCAACLSSAKMAGAGQVEVELPLAGHPGETWLSVEAGDAVTLRCAYRGEFGAARLNWYKQDRGRRPRHVSAYYSYNRNGSFYEEFRDGARFSLDTADGRNDLQIRDARGSDSGTYHCISCFLHTLEFMETVTVRVRGPGPGLGWVHQPASESVRPGGSVNLSCTVYAGTCQGEPGVSWFRGADGGQGIAGLVGGRGTGVCARNDTTHTCVYTLPLRDLDLSHAGTYYCTAAACGLLLIGNGTKLDFGESCEDEGSTTPFPWWYFLGGAFAVALAASLAFSVCKTSSWQATGDTSNFHKVDAKKFQDAEETYFPTLQRQRNGDQTWSECVYYRKK